jgi:uncharacterized membrane protein YsdA (DUF1294 family)
MARRTPDTHRPRATRHEWPSPEYVLLVATLLAGVTLAVLAVGRHLAMFVGASPGAPY